MMNFLIVFLLHGVRCRLSQPEANPQVRRNLLTPENGIMKPNFCLFDIFIPFLAQTSMPSSQRRCKAGHKAVMGLNFQKKRFRSECSESAERPSQSLDPLRGSNGNAAQLASRGAGFRMA